jgi:hypothetical protein
MQDGLAGRRVKGSINTKRLRGQSDQTWNRLLEPVSKAGCFAKTAPA